MSVTVQRTPTDRRAPTGVGARARLALSDGLLVARRNLVTLTRVPTVFIFELVQPVMFVLLFRYIYENQFAIASTRPRLRHVPDAGHLRAERDLRGDDHRGRARRGPQGRHHRSVPLPSDGTVGRAGRPHHVRSAEEPDPGAARDRDRIPRRIPIRERHRARDRGRRAGACRRVRVLVDLRLPRASP